jgi:hypothetical protein
MLIFNVSILTSNYGPSDRVRTCGLMVPNHPRYQLRYTRIFDFRFLKISLSVVIPVVKGNFAASFRRRKSPQTEALQGFPASVRDAVRIPALRSQRCLRGLLYNKAPAFATDFLNETRTCVILLRRSVIS